MADDTVEERLTREDKLENFKEFSRDFCVASPIADDILPALARDLEKQSELQRIATAYVHELPPGPNGDRMNLRLHSLTERHYNNKIRARSSEPLKQAVMNDDVQKQSASVDHSPRMQPAQVFSVPRVRQNSKHKMQRGRSSIAVLGGGQYGPPFSGPRHINPPPPAPYTHYIPSVQNSYTNQTESNGQLGHGEGSASAPLFQHSDPYPRYDDIPGFTQTLDEVAPKPAIIYSETLPI